MPGIPQNGRLHLFVSAQNLQKWAAKPTIFCSSGHEIKGVADHFGRFQAWIPERSDFFKGPEGPQGPSGPERSDFFQGRWTVPKKKKAEKPQDGRQKSGQNIGNPYQMEDNKNPKGAAPEAPPCCLPFGKDFLFFGLTSGAHPEAFPPSFFGDCPPSFVFPQWLAALQSIFSENN